MFTMLETLPWISKREIVFDGMNKLTYELPFGYYLHVAYTDGMPTMICSFLNMTDPILIDETSEEEIFTIVSMTLRGIELPLVNYKA